LNVLPFLGAIGIGAILVKLMDIIWLQKVIKEKDNASWLRDRRLKAYTDLTKELISFGTKHEKTIGAFEIYAFAAEALLLIENDELINKINHFINTMTKMNDLIGIEKADSLRRNTGVNLYQTLTDEAIDIINLLKNDLINKEISTLFKIKKWVKNLLNC